MRSMQPLQGQSAPMSREDLRIGLIAVVLMVTGVAIFAAGMWWAAVMLR
jgi:hypothetical protein